MARVSDLVRKLANDTTVREKRIYTDPLPPPAPKKVSSKPEPNERIVHGTHTTRPLEYRERPDDPTQPPPLDEACHHLPIWVDGVKSCKWCEGVFPVDRRDSTTRWKG